MINIRTYDLFESDKPDAVTEFNKIGPMEIRDRWNLYVDGEHVGDVCPICAHLGPRGAARRMRDRAMALLDQARELMTFGDQVEAMYGRSMDWTWAGLRALVYKELEVEGAFRDIPEQARQAWIEPQVKERADLRELWVKWELATDPERRQELGELYRRASADPSILRKERAAQADGVPF